MDQGLSSSLGAASEGEQAVAEDDAGDGGSDEHNANDNETGDKANVDGGGSGVLGDGLLLSVGLGGAGRWEGRERSAEQRGQ